jgi:stage II sporulation protein D
VTPEELKTKLSLDFIPQNLQVSENSPSGRAEKLTLLALNKKKEFSSQDFRKLLGYAKVKSTQFSIQKTGENYVISGRGFGHGVGLCQWGAKAWAEHGLNYKMILKHYFPQYKLGDETL